MRKSGATLPTGALWVRLNAGERSASTIDRPKLAIRTSGSKRSNLALAGKAIYTLRAGHKHTPCMHSHSQRHFSVFIGPVHSNRVALLVCYPLKRNVRFCRSHSTALSCSLP
jgi:hypothetical protein